MTLVVLAASCLLVACGIARTDASPIANVLQEVDDTMFEAPSWPLYRRYFTPINDPVEYPPEADDGWDTRLVAPNQMAHEIADEQKKTSFSDLFPPSMNSAFSASHPRYSIYVPAFDDVLRSRFESYDDQERRAAHDLTSEGPVDKSPTQHRQQPQQKQQQPQQQQQQKQQQQTPRMSQHLKDEQQQQQQRRRVPDSKSGPFLAVKVPTNKPPPERRGEDDSPETVETSDKEAIAAERTVRRMVHEIFNGSSYEREIARSSLARTAERFRLEMQTDIPSPTVSVDESPLPTVSTESPTLSIEDMTTTTEGSAMDLLDKLFDKYKRQYAKYLKAQHDALLEQDRLKKLKEEETEKMQKQLEEPRRQPRKQDEPRKRDEPKKPNGVAGRTGREGAVTAAPASFAAQTEREWPLTNEIVQATRDEMAAGYNAAVAGEDAGTTETPVAAGADDDGAAVELTGGLVFGLPDGEPEPQYALSESDEAMAAAFAATDYAAPASDEVAAATAKTDEAAATASAEDPAVRFETLTLRLSSDENDAASAAAAAGETADGAVRFETLAARASSEDGTSGQPSDAEAETNDNLPVYFV